VSWLRGDVFEIVIKDNSFVDVDEFKEIQIYKTKMTQNKMHGVLFITPGFGNVSKEALEYAASPEASMNCIAKALIAPSLGMKILSNFFIVFNKPVVKHRVFSGIEDGLIWLQEEIRQATGA